MPSFGEKWPKWWKKCQNGGKMAEMVKKVSEMVEKWPKWWKTAKILEK